MNTVNVHYNHLLAKVQILSWVCMHVVIRVDEKSHYDSQVTQHCWQCSPQFHLNNDSKKE